jgi:hypothetical protein
MDHSVRESFRECSARLKALRLAATQGTLAQFNGRLREIFSSDRGTLSRDRLDQASSALE